MDPYSRSYDGSYVRTYSDTGTGEYTVNTGYAPSRTEDLYAIKSDDTKPYVYKRQHYRKTETSTHQGFFTAVKSSPGRIITIRESGVIGSNAAFGPIGSSTQAVNNAIGNLADSLRGSIDLSIDGFQAKMTKALMVNLFSARKHAERIVMLLESTKDVRPPRKRPVGRSKEYYRQKFKKERWDLVRDRKGLDVMRTPIKFSGNAWLQFTYGLKPTLQTIHDLVMGEAVRVGNSLTVQTRRRDGTSRKHVIGKVTFEQQDRSKVVAATRTITNRKSSYRCLIGGSYQPGTTYVEGLARLTSLNPASIAWELLPFSFVVDWFLDIGGYLRSMETAILSNLLGTFSGFITTTERHESIEQIIKSGLNEADGFTYSGGTKAKTVFVMKNRSLLTTFPLPRPPSFECDLSSGRLLNAAALLTIFIKSRS